MNVKTPKFQRAQDFLVERVRLGPILKRVGLVLKAQIEAGATKEVFERNAARLSNNVQRVVENTQAAFRSHLADFSDDTERLAIEFFFAQSNKLSAATQVELLMKGRHSSTVALAAARQKTVPIELQQALVENAYQHVDAMCSLASNPKTHPKTLLPLSRHPSRNVRIAVAAHIGPRMKVEEKHLDDDKMFVFNTLIENYEDWFAPYIIPVCKDPEQLERMFEQTALTPANAHLFAENPYASNDILLSVVSSNTMGLLPGGQQVRAQVRSLVTNRLNDDGGPTL